MAENSLASDGARVDFGALIDTFLPIIVGLLERDGGFDPIAGYLDSNGQACGLKVTPESKMGDRDDVVDPERSVISLERELKRHAAAGGIKAAVIIAEVQFADDDTSEEEAVWGRFEHCDGSALNLFLPYDRSTRTLHYDGASASPSRCEGLAARRH